MKLKGPGKRLRVYVGANDRCGRQPLYEAIIERARALGLAGCTVIRGVEGFGAAGHAIHRARLLRLSENLPLLIEIVDSEERIRTAVAAIETLIEEGGKGALMTLEAVEILRYTRGAQSPTGETPPA